MKDLLISCAIILCTMAFFSIFWAPCVVMVTSASAELLRFKHYLFFGGLLLAGLSAAYVGWPLCENKKRLIHDPS